MSARVFNCCNKRKRRRGKLIPPCGYINLSGCESLTDYNIFCENPWYKVITHYPSVGRPPQQPTKDIPNLQIYPTPGVNGPEFSSYNYRYTQSPDNTPNSVPGRFLSSNSHDKNNHDNTAYPGTYWISWWNSIHPGNIIGYEGLDVFELQGVTSTANYIICGGSSRDGCGRIGRNEFPEIKGFTLIDEFLSIYSTNKDVVEISAGGDHSCARFDGSGKNWFCWGSNEYNQAGLTEATFDAVIFSKIGCGMNHTVAFNEVTGLTAWGQNNYGQCDIPVGISLINPELLLSGFAVGGYHFIGKIQGGGITGFGRQDHRFEQNIPDESAYFAQNFTGAATVPWIAKTTFNLGEENNPHLIIQEGGLIPYNLRKLVLAKEKERDIVYHEEIKNADNMWAGKYFSACYLGGKTVQYRIPKFSTAIGSEGEFLRYEWKSSNWVFWGSLEEPEEGKISGSTFSFGIIIPPSEFFKQGRDLTDEYDKDYNEEELDNQKKVYRIAGQDPTTIKDIVDGGRTELFTNSSANHFLYNYLKLRETNGGEETQYFGVKGFGDNTFGQLNLPAILNKYFNTLYESSESQELKPVRWLKAVQIPFIEEDFYDIDLSVGQDRSIIGIRKGTINIEDSQLKMFCIGGDVLGDSGCEGFIEGLDLNSRIKKIYTNPDTTIGFDTLGTVKRFAKSGNKHNLYAQDKPLVQNVDWPYLLDQNPSTYDSVYNRLDQFCDIAPVGTRDWLQKNPIRNNAIFDEETSSRILVNIDFVLNVRERNQSNPRNLGPVVDSFSFNTQGVTGEEGSIFPEQKNGISLYLYGTRQDQRIKPFSNHQYDASWADFVTHQYAPAGPHGAIINDQACPDSETYQYPINQITHNMIEIPPGKFPPELAYPCRNKFCKAAVESWCDPCFGGITGDRWAGRLGCTGCNYTEEQKIYYKNLCNGCTFEGSLWVCPDSNSKLKQIKTEEEYYYIYGTTFNNKPEHDNRIARNTNQFGELITPVEMAWPSLNRYLIPRWETLLKDQDGSGNKFNLKRKQNTAQITVSRMQVDYPLVVVPAHGGDIGEKYNMEAYADILAAYKIGRDHKLSEYPFTKNFSSNNRQDRIKIESLKGITFRSEEISEPLCGDSSVGCSPNAVPLTGAEVAAWGFDLYVPRIVEEIKSIIPNIENIEIGNIGITGSYSGPNGGVWIGIAKDRFDIDGEERKERLRVMFPVKLEEGETLKFGNDVTVDGYSLTVDQHPDYVFELLVKATFKQYPNEKGKNIRNDNAHEDYEYRWGRFNDECGCESRRSIFLDYSAAINYLNSLNETSLVQLLQKAANPRERASLTNEEKSSLILGLEKTKGVGLVQYWNCRDTRTFLESGEGPILKIAVSGLPEFYIGLSEQADDLYDVSSTYGVVTPSQTVYAGVPVSVFVDLPGIRGIWSIPSNQTSLLSSRGFASFYSNNDALDRLVGDIPLEAAHPQGWLGPPWPRWCNSACGSQIGDSAFSQTCQEGWNINNVTSIGGCCKGDGFFNLKRSSITDNNVPSERSYGATKRNMYRNIYNGFWLPYFRNPNVSGGISWKDWHGNPYDPCNYYNWPCPGDTGNIGFPYKFGPSWIQHYYELAYGIIGSYGRIEDYWKHKWWGYPSFIAVNRDCHASFYTMDFTRNLINAGTELVDTSFPSLPYKTETGTVPMYKLGWNFRKYDSITAQSRLDSNALKARVTNRGREESGINGRADDSPRYYEPFNHDWLNHPMVQRYQSGCRLWPTDLYHGPGFYPVYNTNPEVERSIYFSTIPWK